MKEGWLGTEELTIREDCAREGLGKPPQRHRIKDLVVRG